MHSKRKKNIDHADCKINRSTYFQHYIRSASFTLLTLTILNRQFIQYTFKRTQIAKTRKNYFPLLTFTIVSRIKSYSNRFN